MRATAKLFKNGRSQAVRLPAEFRFEGTEVDIRRDDLTGEVILSEKRDGAAWWKEFVRLRNLALDQGLSPDFMKDRDQGSSQRDDILDDLLVDARHEHGGGAE